MENCFFIGITCLRLYAVRSAEQDFSGRLRRSGAASGKLPRSEVVYNKQKARPELRRDQKAGGARGRGSKPSAIRAAAPTALPGDRRDSSSAKLRRDILCVIFAADDAKSSKAEEAQTVGLTASRWRQSGNPRSGTSPPPAQPVNPQRAPPNTPNATLIGSGTAVKFTPQLSTWAWPPPADRSASTKVQSPFGLNPARLANVVVPAAS